jgi:uncharacterized membrane protein YcaP (DUF421 family)
MVDADFSLTNGMLLVITLVAADIGISLLKQRAPAVEPWIDGVPMLLVIDGKPLRERLDEQRVDESDMLEAARKNHGLERSGPSPCSLKSIAAEGTMSALMVACI